ncbi:MAG TPA: glycosyltransferase [Thermoleptolyngbya sp. M55_K2018_002]|nr:glycosyltransferase [Thermoleptolyngbya sp. M55_K2018_002]
MELLREEPSSDQYPRVGVVIPILNGAADLPELLSCLSQQTYSRERIQYVLIDNGSGDRTPDLLQTAAMQFQSLGLTLRPLTVSDIQSAYAARNAGIVAALSGDTPCEIIAFTDVDCRPNPDWLRNLVQPFAEPQVGLVAGEVLPLKPATWLERYAARREFLSQRHTLSHGFLPYGQTANLAVRRSPLEAVGLFRPYLTSGGDADLCWRILQTGQWELRLAEGAIARHRHRATLPALWKQWQRYGRSDAHLHELHGSALMRSLTWQDAATRLARWLLKELPSVAPHVLREQEPWDRLLDTPLDLFCAAARSWGQRRSSFPEAARAIAWLPDGTRVNSPHQ